MNTEIDQFPVSELPARYQIGRTALYERMNTLAIKPTKRGTKSYLSGEQLCQMDDLDLHLKSGGGLGNFKKPVQQTFTEQTEQLSIPNSQSISPTAPSAMETVIKGIVQSVFTQIASQPGMRLSHLRELEEAYEKKWILSTSELADLLGLSANTVRGYGDQFEEAGFIFKRFGTRSRGELAWKIEKTDHK